MNIIPDKSMILLRCSTLEQEPELQKKDCITYNNSKGWELTHIFEKNESAYKTNDVWFSEIEIAKKENIRHIIVWNMDRYSREPEDVVLDRIKILSVIHNIQLHSVHSDAWSEIAESIGNLNSMGFVGKAITEFLETLIRGFEHQRAHRESSVKSDRVKLAVRKKEIGTYSYKGNKWGRKSLSKQTRSRIIQIKINNPSYSLRQIMAHEDCYFFDKHNNKKKLSLGTVHKLLSNFHTKKDSI